MRLMISAAKRAAIARHVHPETLRERGHRRRHRHTGDRRRRSGKMQRKCRYNRDAPQQRTRHLAASRNAKYIHGIGELHRERHHGSRGARARPQAARHVHRRRRHRRPASPRLGNTRQRDRRGDERLRLERPRHAARGWLVHHDRGRRPGHSGRQAPDDEEERPRGDLHGAPRGREVRAGQLQDGRRSPRRRRERRQRAVEGARRHGEARRRPLGNALPSRQARRSAEKGRPRARHRHDGLLPSGRHHLSEDRVRSGDHPRTARGGQLHPQGPEGRLRRRDHEDAGRPSSMPRGWSNT